MTLLEKWNAILHIIAQNETPSVNAAEDAPGQVEELRCRYIAEVEALQARIDQLEAQNAGLKARPTATKPREDASLGDLRRTPNQEAYEADIKMFK